MVWNERCHYDKRTYVLVCVCAWVCARISLSPAPSITDRVLSFVPRPFLPSTLSLSSGWLFALPGKEENVARLAQHSCPGERWAQKSGVGVNLSSKSYYIWQLRKKCLTNVMVWILMLQLYQVVFAIKWDDKIYDRIPQLLPPQAHAYTGANTIK